MKKNTELEAMYMNLFEHAATVAKEVSESVVDSAKSLGSSIHASTKEQYEAIQLKIQKASIARKLHESYAELGEKYVEFIRAEQAGGCFEASDLIQSIQVDLDKIAQIDAVIAEKELNAKKEEEEEEEEKLLKKAEDEYRASREKLDKALALDIITKAEYEEKLIPIQKRFDNHVQLRKIDAQLEMEIITPEEHYQKVADLLK